MKRDKLRELKNDLYDSLCCISEYHSDVRPTKKDSLNTLLEKYFYWASEYNDNYLPDEDEELQQMFNQYLQNN